MEAHVGPPKQSCGRNSCMRETIMSIPLPRPVWCNPRWHRKMRQCPVNLAEWLLFSLHWCAFSFARVQYRQHSLWLSLRRRPSDVQLELIELSSSTTFIDIYRQLPPPQFPMLLAGAKRVIMFGSTCSCMQLFSKMKFCKNKLRSHLIDDLTQKKTESLLSIFCEDVRLDIRCELGKVEFTVLICYIVFIVLDETFNIYVTSPHSIIN